MKELIESVEEYVRKPYTDYAIMINGEWGSGKTYFWNNKLRKRIEIIENGKGSTYKTIYISLYGINSIEEISKKIFLETNPLITKTLKKFVENSDGNMIPEYVKAGVDVANLYGSMQVDNNKLDFSKLFSTDNKVLCFDDLERANIDIIDILGYINNFVEHDGIKTILICNEKELAIKFKNNNIEMKTLIATLMLDKEKKKAVSGMLEEPVANKLQDKIESIFDRANAYERIKEKLVGECFEYVPEYGYILSGMIMRYDYNKPFEIFLKKEIALIINTFNKTNTKNLRVLKHALNDFERIYNNITMMYPEATEELLKVALVFTIAISFEIKVGSVVKGQFIGINSNEDYMTTIYDVEGIEDARAYYLREFDTRYFINIKEDYRFYKFIEVYVRTRIFDDRLFKQDMDKAIVKKESIKEQQYMKILSGTYWKLADFDYEILADQVLYDIKEGEVPNKEYIKLFSVFKELSDMGLLKVNFDEMRERFILGFKRTLAKGKTTDNINPSEVTSNDEQIQSFINETNRIKEKVYDEQLRERVSKMFEKFPAKIDEFYKEAIEEFENIAIFKKYDMDLLYNKLANAQNYDLYNFITLINTRYENKKVLLKEDKAGLKKLAEIIEKKLEDKDATIKTALLMKLKESLERLTK